MRELIADRVQPRINAPAEYRMRFTGRSADIALDYALLLFRKGPGSQSGNAGRGQYEAFARAIGLMKKTKGSFKTIRYNIILMYLID